ncbi:putative Fis-like DNA-binding protein [Methylophilaceae bacterium]|jgi:Fis family transcriptional regulator|nr:Fis family transcriptional regulator [Candidatus Methylopumilus sp.]GDX55434.1 putative Fis-like DNA-binding protein [Methylophilaceae bacterium]
MEKKTDIPDCVNQSLDQYFKDLNGENPTNVYDMVVGLIEKPLLTYIMGISKGNQSKAAEILGLNRNTLRKKLKQHKIDI